MKKKVISIVLHNFILDSRVLNENTSLQNNGYKVQIIALHADGLKEYDKMKNIPIHRIKLKSRNWSKNKVIQLLKYMEFIYWILKQYRDSDIVHCNDINTLPIGVMLKLFFNKKIKIVYDAHEYETEVHGLSGIQKKLVQKLEKYLISYADKVMTVSDAIAEEYVKLYHIEKPSLVLNTPWYRNVEKKNIFRDTFHIAQNKTIFLYQGGLSYGRGIEILIETFKSIKNHRSVIVFMGSGVLEAQVKQASEEHENIFFHQAVNPDILLEYTSSADFGILFYENNCLNHYYCSPNKMFEYMMAGIPVIASNLYEMRRLIEYYAIGVVAEENTPKGLRKAIEKAMLLEQNELQKNIQKVKEVYNWEEQEKILLEVYRELE